MLSKLKSWILARRWRRKGPGTNRPLLVPVAWADAVAWAKGLRSDREMLLRATLKPEAIFILNLPSRAAYREVIGQIQYWAGQGAKAIIARTANPIVAAQLAGKLGSLPTYAEPGGQGEYRYFMPPAGLKRLLDRWESTKACKN